MNSERSLGNNRTYQMCTRCIMDTTDPDIVFDEQGVCNHCTGFIERLESRKYIKGESEKEWNHYLAAVKSKGEGKKYDCILGISGGVDSCYAAYLCKQQGLRTLLIHMDNGWDTEIAVNNIKTLARNLGFDYMSYVLDWEEFRDIQLAYLKASSVDLEMPTDVAIPACIYEVAVKHKIKYIISGGNLSSEGILPLHWGYHVYKDMKMYRHIVGKYGNTRIRKVPVIGLLKESYYRFIYGIKTLYILNYTNYNKDVAKQYLMDNLDWKDYGGKHHESKITAFWQSYAMYVKFGIDYRKAILSSQICLH
ncbi:MAG TPA: N-acetyl sugar amidotransferase, partial [Chitinophagaceae bacterium]|nr:N-acetyl sugar amidotransferase [Chitinophagaceae bacterium]